MRCILVSSACAIFLHIKGHVGMDAEIQKAAKRLEKTKQGIERQKKILGDECYKEKVSKELQEVEMNKLKNLKMERNPFGETLSSLSS